VAHPPSSVDGSCWGASAAPPATRGRGGHKRRRLSDTCRCARQRGVRWRRSDATPSLVCRSARRLSLRRAHLLAGRAHAPSSPRARAARASPPSANLRALAAQKRTTCLGLHQQHTCIRLSRPAHLDWPVAGPMSLPCRFVSMALGGGRCCPVDPSSMISLPRSASGHNIPLYSGRTGLPHLSTGRVRPSARPTARGHCRGVEHHPHTSLRVPNAILCVGGYRARIV
jgi:hypothetical protein